MQGIMDRAKRKRAPTPTYVSPKQLALEVFASPFASRLKSTNRWVVLGNLIPWDEICGTYLKHVGISNTGRPPLSPRVVIGSMIIKHMMNLDDREVVDQISENIYMQYFLGYQSFSVDPPFDPSLFVEFRKKLGMDQVNAINEKIILLKTHLETPKKESKPDDLNDTNQNSAGNGNRGRVCLFQPKSIPVFHSKSIPFLINKKAVLLCSGYPEHKSTAFLLIKNGILLE